MTTDTALTIAVVIYAVDKLLGWSIGLYRLRHRANRERAEFAEQARVQEEAMRKALAGALKDIKGPPTS